MTGYIAKGFIVLCRLWHTAPSKRLGSTSKLVLCHQEVCLFYVATNGFPTKWLLITRNLAYDRIVEVSIGRAGQRSRGAWMAGPARLCPATSLWMNPHRRVPRLAAHAHLTVAVCRRASTRAQAHVPHSNFDVWKSLKSQVVFLTGPYDV